MLFRRKVTDLSGRIIERNQAKSSQAYAATQDIDEALENLAKAMPTGYWEIPTFIDDDRSEKAAATFDRMMTQIWFYQVR